MPQQVQHTMIQHKNQKDLIPFQQYLQHCHQHYSYSWVSGIVLRNISFHLPNKVSTNISSFCINTTTYTAEKSHRRTTKSITSNSFKKAFPVITIINSKQINCNVKDQETACSKQETHNGTRPESSDKSLSNTLPGLQSRPSICISCNLHSKKTRYQRGNCTKHKSYSAKDSICKGRLASLVLAVVARLALRAEALNRPKEEENKNCEDAHE
ncbi:Os02g0184300 [Oryza sativa Japonica Group]|uniref:Os02g0184300 protein n=1 Tax=Oryza sativa subsp. japonica TaxID=39947 RepID=A0A0P0VFR8_ORYSJ|nr:Os02g0184300 [Oryza sativa Japonica Group]